MPSAESAHQEDKLDLIYGELKEIKEILASTTGDGMPLRALVPTSELLASLIAAASLISRDTPMMHTADLQQRVAAAQVLASELIKQFDAYQAAKQGAQFSALAHEPPQPGSR